MPSNEIMRDFHQGTLHSGRGGPIVKSKRQARAIQLSYLRKEGHDIPEKKGLARAYRREKNGGSIAHG